MSHFSPSLYQQAILEEMATGQGHVQINACAGAAKTTTLLLIIAQMHPMMREATLLCAFNTSIRDELQRRAPAGVTVSTNHAIGRMTVFTHLRREGFELPKEWIDNRKYSNLVAHYALSHNWREDERKPDEREPELKKLVDFARFNLIDASDTRALDRLIEDYTLEVSDPARQIPAVETILAWGIHGIEGRQPGLPTFGYHEAIDFVDMLWLPSVLRLTPRRYQFVLCDECQDLSAAQLALLRASLYPGGRLVAVGDPRQAVYSFAGADHRSWEKISQIPEMQQMPLSICYRCPKKVVELAKTIVPQIEAREDAPEGELWSVEEEQLFELLQPDDMVLCRTNAPLFDWALALIAEGRPAKIRGRDVAANLKEMVWGFKRWKGFTWSNFGECLRDWKHAQYLKFAGAKNEDSLREQLDDRIASIAVLQRGALSRGAKSFEDLIKLIEEIFSDKDDKDMIWFSSIHRAKGLEKERVFILRPDLLPHPMARSEVEQAQEEHLRYVAITRAQFALHFVSDKIGWWSDWAPLWGTQTKTGPVAPPVTLNLPESAPDASDEDPWEDPVLFDYDALPSCAEQWALAADEPAKPVLTFVGPRRSNYGTLQIVLGQCRRTLCDLPLQPEWQPHETPAGRIVCRDCAAVAAEMLKR